MYIFIYEFAFIMNEIMADYIGLKNTRIYKGIDHVSFNSLEKGGLSIIFLKENVIELKIAMLAFF